MPEYHPSPDLSHAIAPASHIFEMAQGMVDLPPRVEERKDVLVHEVLELCRKYGLSHPKELETSPLASKIPLEDLGRLLACITKLEYIVAHHVLPVEEQKEQIDDREYEIELPQEARVTKVLDNLGRPVVAGYIQDRKRTFFVKDSAGRTKTFLDSSLGEIKGVSLAICHGEPVMIQTFKEEGEEVAYRVSDLDGFSVGDLRKVTYQRVFLGEQEIESVDTRDDKGRPSIHPVDANGKILGRPEGYFLIWSVTPVGEHTYFVANEEKNAKQGVFDERGNQVDIGVYDDIFCLVNLTEELVLCVKKGSRWFFVYSDGTLLDDEPEEGFGGEMAQIQVFDGKIYFLERKEHFLDTQEVSKSFRDHTNRDFHHSFHADFTPLKITKIGDALFYFTAGNKGSIDLSRLTPDGSEVHFGKSHVFPILLGDLFVYATLCGTDRYQLFVDNRDLHAGFEQIHVLEPLDDHRFYVIAQDKGKIIKKVFDMRNIKE